MPSLKRQLEQIDQLAKELQARGLKPAEAVIGAISILQWRATLEKTRRSMRELHDQDLDEFEDDD